MSTIFALSTVFGKSGVAVFRISGEKSLDILIKITKKTEFHPRKSYLVKIWNQDEILDEALAIYFSAPQSFTGEDVVEIHTHGSIAVIKMLSELLSQHASIAEPGEFSKRAFWNQKIDLTQAEGLVDLINSETEMQHKNAILQARGFMKNIFENLRYKTLRLLALIESCIDFPEEDIPQSVLAEIQHIRSEVLEEIKEYLKNADSGERLRSGIRITILGKPNSGKSSLINFLSRRSVSIVSDIAGTTRDMIESHINIKGYPFTIIDTAGIRDTEDIIEQEGIRRALEASETSDITIMMHDSQDKIILDPKYLNVINKIDLQRTYDLHLTDEICIAISCKTLEGMDKLEDELLKIAVSKTTSPVITRVRYKQALENALFHLENNESDFIILAEEARSAANYIGSITGKIDVEEILGEIFSTFCIGK